MKGVAEYDLEQIALDAWTDEAFQDDAEAMASLQVPTPGWAGPVGVSRRRFLAQAAGVAAGAALAPLAPPALARMSAIEIKIERYFKSLRRQGIIPGNERTAWSVYDFTTGRKLVSINENRPRQSASMIKPFVAQAYFYKNTENPRRYDFGRQVKELMEGMIRYSDNGATNYFIDRVGNGNPRQVEQVLKQRAPGIFQQTRIVEHIPHNGRTYRNLASARDYSRFLYAIWNNSLPHADQVKYYMGLPNRDRLYNGPHDSAITYDKTGSTARLCGNMGIIVAKGRDGRRYPYTFIGIIEKSSRTNNYTYWVRHRGRIIHQVSRLVYDELKQLHNLV